jgi:hypothetical protein
MNDRTDAITVARTGATGGQSVSVSTASAATGAAIGSTECLVYSTVECFALAGPATPTATVAQGTPIPALTLIRLRNLRSTDLVAFITASGTGTVYVRPGA